MFEPFIPQLRIPARELRRGVKPSANWALLENDIETREAIFVEKKFVFWVRLWHSLIRSIADWWFGWTWRIAERKDLYNQAYWRGYARGKATKGVG